MRPTTIDPGQFKPRKQLPTLRNLLPYLSPTGRADPRARVASAPHFLLAPAAAPGRIQTNHHTNHPDTFYPSIGDDFIMNFD